MTPTFQSAFFHNGFTDGGAEPFADEHDLLHMGVIPFLLNPRHLDDLISRR